MFGPLTLIPRDPIIALVLVVAFVFGLILHNLAQAHAAARHGDRAALDSEFGQVEPLHHVSVGALVWYLLLGLGLPRPVPVRLTGKRAALVLLSGPLTLLAWAFLLMIARQLLQPVLPTLDVVHRGVQLAAMALLLHAVFFLMPFPGLAGGRALFEVSSAGPRRMIGHLSAAGPLALYIVWLALWLSGAAHALLTPLWNALQSALSWLPF